MRHLVLGLTIATTLAGCATVERVTPNWLRAKEPAPIAKPQLPEVQTKEAALEPETPLEEAEPAPSAKPSGPRDLGEVVVALGDPTQSGLWVKTSLVSEKTPGRITTQAGETLTVDLLPLGDGDGGAQISLQALQAMSLPLAGLTTVKLSTL